VVRQGERQGEAAAGFARASILAGTCRGFVSDLKQFRRWLAGYPDGVSGDRAVLDEVSVCPVGPETVVKFLTDKALSATPDGVGRYAPSTMSRWLSAITRDHVEQGFVSPCAHPTVTAVLSGIRREHARPRRQAAPLLLEMLQKTILATDITRYPGGIFGPRDIGVWRIILVDTCTGPWALLSFMQVACFGARPHPM
jgi:hypothetical protein